MCESDRRAAVDEALQALPIREVASKYGFSRSAVHRHKQSCIPVAAIRREVMAEQAMILAPREPRDGLQPTTATDAGRVLTALKDRFLTELEVAEKSGKPLSLPIMRELRSTLELIVKTSLAQEAKGYGDERATTVEYIVRPGCCPRDGDERCRTCDMRSDGPVASLPAPVVEEVAAEVEAVPVAPAGPHRETVGEWMNRTLREAEEEDGD